MTKLCQENVNRNRNKGYNLNVKQGRIQTKEHK